MAVTKEKVHFVLGRSRIAKKEAGQYEIPLLDLVIVDLYPFEETVASGAAEKEIIEKIDIGGISLIRAAAKNHKDVLIVSHQGQYGKLLDLLNKQNCATSMTDRRQFAAEAFATSSHYDTSIYKYFAGESSELFRQSFNQSKTLRYGENPHQKGEFHGNLAAVFDKIQGKELLREKVNNEKKSFNSGSISHIVLPQFACLR